MPKRLTLTALKCGVVVAVPLVNDVVLEAVKDDMVSATLDGSRRLAARVSATPGERFKRPSHSPSQGHPSTDERRPPLDPSQAFL